MYDSGGYDEKTRVTDGISFKPEAEMTNDALVLIYPPGPDMGRKYKLEAGIVNVGRDASNQIVVNSDSVSRKHARLTLESGRRMISDLKSTNGTYVNNMPTMSQHLKNGDQVKIGDSIFKYLVGTDVESAYHEEIYTMTIKDGLTEIYNRRYFEEALERELSRAQRHHRELSILIFDIDFFKKANDTFGHLAGDYVLRELAFLVANRSRHEEVFARYGGEEFVILLPESNNEEAMVLAEQLRRLVEEHKFIFEGEEIPVTISIGVMTTGAGKEKLTSQEFIKAADEQLYLAKSQGRNCVRGRQGN